MKQNVGDLDRFIRVIIGVLLLSLLIFLDGGTRWIGLIGLIPLATALMNYCPLYTLFGINTKQSQN